MGRKKTNPSANPVDRREAFISGCRRIVLKLGTKVLLAYDRGEREAEIRRLVEDIAAFREKGYEFSIVTSGAVGLGMKELGLDSRPTDIKKIQALASIGQTLLMQKWNALFEARGVRTGQILLTYDIIENRNRFLHARDCLRALIGFKGIPIINENDSVAVEELKFGDNDTLSALAAVLLDADLLVLFSDIDGVFSRNPHRYADAERISYVDRIDDSLFSRIEDKQNGLSLGGMRSKLLAAQRSASMGTGVVITSGMNPNLRDILQGRDIGTFIRPEEKYEKKRKRWIFFNHKIRGKIIVDEGAENALVHGSKSLLPGGIVRTEKEFPEGSIVGIYNLRNEMIGKGITHYSSEDIEKIKGRRTDQVRAFSTKRFSEEVIHRDNMIVLTGRQG
ncbi:glutamate 5-kinase [bacterium]|nr:glutamate 5-kinase [bacterium]